VYTSGLTGETITEDIPIAADIAIWLDSADAQSPDLGPIEWSPTAP